MRAKDLSGSVDPEVLCDRLSRLSGSDRRPSEEVSAAVVNLLSFDDEFVRSDATRVFVRWGDPKALSELTRLLSASLDYPDFSAVVLAMANIGESYPSYKSSIRDTLVEAARRQDLEPEYRTEAALQACWMYNLVSLQERAEQTPVQCSDLLLRLESESRHKAGASDL